MIRTSWTRVASIEETLALWAASLREIKKRIRPLFKQDRVAASAGQFLEGLLGDEQRKTGWMRAEAAGDPGPWRQQAILGRRDWDADALRDIVRDYVIENLADDDAVLVIDETGFLKQGKASCGVARQYTGSAGKITNCQIGVFATSAVNGAIKGHEGLLYGNPSQVLIQLTAVLAAGLFSFGVSFVILKLTDAVVGLRVDEETEVRGLDLAEHSEEGYILD